MASAITSSTMETIISPTSNGRITAYIDRLSRKIGSNPNDILRYYQDGTTPIHDSPNTAADIAVFLTAFNAIMASNIPDNIKKKMQFDFATLKIVINK